MYGPCEWIHSHGTTDIIFSEMLQETSMPKLKTLVLILGMTTVNAPSVEHHSICCVHGGGCFNLIEAKNWTELLHWDSIGENLHSMK